MTQYPEYCKKILSKNIRFFRYSANLTMDQLAIKAGVSKGTVFAAEVGSNITIEKGQLIALALGRCLNRELNLFDLLSKKHYPDKMPAFPKSLCSLSLDNKSQ